MIGQPLPETDFKTPSQTVEAEYDLEYGLPEPPTLEEIIQRAAKIRAGWSIYQRNQRNEQSWVLW